MFNAIPAIQEMNDLTAAALDNRERSGAAQAIMFEKGIEFSNVSFFHLGYDRPALQDISLFIPAKRTTAIFGASGSGKSTFADLLMGLIEPATGSIRVDDAPLNRDNIGAWRQKIAYVEQSPFLLHESIRANLIWGNPETSEADMIAALQLASAEFVLSRPGGIDAVVGDGGMRLSGGERQRIALARALLRQPSLLLLDEATSALDRVNEEAISRAIAQLRGRMTIVIIGHQNWIRDCADHKIELAQGRLRQAS